MTSRWNWTSWRSNWGKFLNSVELLSFGIVMIIWHDLGFHNSTVMKISSFWWQTNDDLQVLKTQNYWNILSLLRSYHNHTCLTTYALFNLQQCDNTIPIATPHRRQRYCLLCSFALAEAEVAAQRSAGAVQHLLLLLPPSAAPAKDSSWNELVALHSVSYTDRLHAAAAKSPGTETDT